MKKFLLIFVAVMSVAFQANAQKVGYIDTEKILSSIPAYKSAQQQLEALSTQYQSAIEAEYAKVEVLYNRYHNVTLGAIFSSVENSQRLVNFCRGLPSFRSYSYSTSIS